MFLEPLEMTFGLPASTNAAFVQRKASPAPPAASNKKVHLLLIGHSRDGSIGSGVQVTARNIEQMFTSTSLFDTSELTINTVGLPGGAVIPGVPRRTYSALSTNQVDSAIDAMTVGPDDTIFCYVMCHGAYDGNHRTAAYEYGHWFQMETGSSSYPRVNLMEKLLSKSARLTVLVSDSCNVRVDISSPASAPAAASLTTIDSIALRGLMLDNSGQVSLSATSEGEFSFYYPAQGGFFSNAFIETLRWVQPDITWPDFFSTLQSEVDSAFDRAFPMGYPYAFINGRPVAVTNPAQFQKTFTPKAMRSLTLVTSKAVSVVTPSKNPPGFPNLPPEKLKGLSNSQLANLEALKKSEKAKELTGLVKKFN
ncbi:MAG: caspase family protein, partial [Planctomycetaceae bacterium]|nr:caspase family protein [Planctomycetaceae bacterium]